MRAGDRVGTFRLVREVARGGMGTVWRGEEDAGTPVAIKLLLDSDWSTLARFAREAALLGDLSHPNIVRYVDHGSSESGPWLAMEWLDADPLSLRLERGLSIVDAVAVCAQVADALGAAHRIGVIHRDIKPSNVLVLRGTPPAARVIDFGIARLSGDRGASVTRTGYLVGTPGYAAPEQIRRARDVDARCDVFALGCILYLGVTGRSAFSGSELRATLTRTLYADPIPIARLVDGVPPALDALICRMLSKDPDERPADGGEVAAALTGLGELPSTVSPSAARRSAPSTVTIEVPPLAAIVIGWDDDDPGTDTARGLPDDVIDERARRIAAIGEAHSVAFDTLVDGGFSAMIDVEDRATLVRAARCAIAIAEAEPKSRIAVVTGARDPGDGGEVLDRACQEVTAATLAGVFVASPRGIVRVDRTVASSVEGRALGIGDDMFEI